MHQHTLQGSMRLSMAMRQGPDTSLSVLTERQLQVFQVPDALTPNTPVLSTDPHLGVLQIPMAEDGVLAWMPLHRTPEEVDQDPLQNTKSYARCQRRHLSPGNPHSRITPSQHIWRLWEGELRFLLHSLLPVWMLQTRQHAVIERTWLTTTLETRLKTTGILFSTTIPLVAGQLAARAVHLARDMEQDISKMVCVPVIWKNCFNYFKIWPFKSAGFINIYNPFWGLTHREEQTDEKKKKLFGLWFLNWQLRNVKRLWMMPAKTNSYSHFQLRLSIVLRAEKLDIRISGFFFLFFLLFFSFLFSCFLLFSFLLWIKNWNVPLISSSRTARPCTGPICDPSRSLHPAHADVLTPLCCRGELSSQVACGGPTVINFSSMHTHTHRHRHISFVFAA